MSTSTAPAKRPTHGHLRKRRRPGLNSLSMAATILGFLGVAGAVIASLFSAGLLTSALWLVGCIVLGALLQFRSLDGLTVLQRWNRWRTYWAQRHAGFTLYRAGLLGVVPGRRAQLPGLLADTQLATGYDSYGREFAVVIHAATGDHAVTFEAQPDGSALVDWWVQDERVATWGAVLASFSDEAALIGATVTIEAAPDPGYRLANAVEAAIVEDSPELAKRVMRRVVQRYPEGSSSLRGYVTLTFTNRAGQRRRSTEEIVRDLASRLPKLSDRLSGSGTGMVRPMTAGELCEVVRIAYDPHAAPVIEQARAAGEDLDLQWDEVGPLSSDARPTYLLHENAVSVTKQMTHPPRGVFQADVLEDLLAPHQDVPRKRITLIFEVEPADRAAQSVQSDLNDAQFRASSSVRPSARIRAEHTAAEAAAEAEAAGAGVVNVGMLVTSTVVDPGLQPGQKISRRNRNRNREERLARAVDDAEAAVHSLSGAARVRLRTVTRSQDSAFAACLPIGLNLSRHLLVPAELREAM